MRAVHMLWVAGVWREFTTRDRADSFVIAPWPAAAPWRAHRGVVLVIIHVDVGDRQAERILDLRDSR